MNSSLLKQLHFSTWYPDGKSLLTDVLPGPLKSGNARSRASFIWYLTMAYDESQVPEIRLLKVLTPLVLPMIYQVQTLIYAGLI